MVRKSQNRKVRILIAGASSTLRESICRSLEGTGEMEIVAETRHLTGTLQKARALAPDVIVIDDFLPPMDTGHASAFLMREGISAAVLAFTHQLEPEWIHYLFRHGVNGFIHRDELDDLVEEAVRVVYRGEPYFSPEARHAYGK